MYCCKGSRNIHTVDQVEVLRYDLRAWARKIQSVALLSPAKVMQLKDEMFRQVRFVSPDDPTNSSIDKTKLVSRDVDTLHSREGEVPVITFANLCICEGSNEATRCGINVDGDIHASRLFILVQDVVDLPDWLVVSGVGTSENNEHTYRVLVNVLLDKLWVEAIVGFGRHGQNSSLNLEVARKLLQRNLSIRSHENIGLRRILACSLALFLPTPLHGKTSQVDGF